MKKSFFKIKNIALAGFCILGMSVFTASVPADSVEELNQKKEQKQGEIEALENELADLLKETGEIDAKASELVADVYEANENLSKQEEIQNNQYHAMKLRVQYMYENRMTSIEESLLSSSDMGDFLNAAAYYQNLYDYDRSRLEEIEDTKRQIEQTASKLKKEIEEIDAVRADMAERQAQITSIVSSKQEELSRIDSDIAQAALAAAKAEEERQKAERLQEEKLAEIEAAAIQALENGRDAEDEVSEVVVASNVEKNEDNKNAKKEITQEAKETKESSVKSTTKHAEEKHTAETTKNKAVQPTTTTVKKTTTAKQTTTPKQTTTESKRESSNNNQSSSSVGKAALVAEYARNNNGTFPCKYGWCAAWVSGIYSKAGVTPPYGNAIDYWKKWSWSGGTGKYNIPLGACVVSSGAGYLAETYGHVGIYIGNGLVASNVGYLKVESIDSFDSSATATCNGYKGYIGWVWPYGNALK